MKKKQRTSEKLKGTFLKTKICETDKMLTTLIWGKKRNKLHISQMNKGQKYKADIKTEKASILFAKS